MSTPGFAVKLSKDQLQNMVNIVIRNPVDLLLSEECRRYLAFDRWVQQGKPIAIHGDNSSGVMPGAIEHNRRELEQTNNFNSTKRTLRLINPLSSLEPIFSNAPHLKVLSIGPRTEMELLHLMAVGFQPANIKAIDLISSSPSIDLGDMHHMPYLDQSFNVVISSWVLNYSSQPQQAIDDMLRVCVDGGLVAIGLTYDPSYGANYAPGSAKGESVVGSMQRSADDLMRLIGNRLDNVLFQQSPDTNDTKGPVMLIARIKHASKA